MRFLVAGYDGHTLVKAVFVAVDDDKHARRLIRHKVARLKRPDLDWLVFRCDDEPIDRIEQSRSFRTWARRQVARRAPVKVFDDELTNDSD